MFIYGDKNIHLDVYNKYWGKISLSLHTKFYVAMLTTQSAIAKKVIINVFNYL